MSSFKNSRTKNFLASVPQCSLDSERDQLTAKCKFNFSYFVKQDAGQSFDEWSGTQLAKLLDKMKNYSQESLTYWTNQPSKSGKVLIIYGKFPNDRSDFTHPIHVPHEVEWGRFRLESAVRLVGFVIPNGYKDTPHRVTHARFDCNTFYVVFLDANHKFYKTENK